MSCHLVAQMRKMTPAFYEGKWNLLVVLFSSKLIGLLVAAVRDGITSTVLAVTLMNNSSVTSVKNSEKHNL